MYRKTFRGKQTNKTVRREATKKNQREEQELYRPTTHKRARVVVADQDDSQAEQRLAEMLGDKFANNWADECDAFYRMNHHGDHLGVCAFYHAVLPAPLRYEYDQRTERCAIAHCDKTVWEHKKEYFQAYLDDKDIQADREDLKTYGL